MLMDNSDPVAIERWLKKRYKLLFLRINERTDHAFAIVDLPELPPNLSEQPPDCRLSLSTPRQAERDFIRCWTSIRVPPSLTVTVGRNVCGKLDVTKSSEILPRCSVLRAGTVTGTAYPLSAELSLYLSRLFDSTSNFVTSSMTSREMFGVN